MKTWAATITQIPSGIENSPAETPVGFDCGPYPCVSTVPVANYPLAEDGTLEEWLMLKICEWESACQYHHWEDWKIVISPNVGALGFVQMMPFNSTIVVDPKNWARIRASLPRRRSFRHDRRTR